MYIYIYMLYLIDIYKGCFWTPVPTARCRFNGRHSFRHRKDAPSPTRRTMGVNHHGVFICIYVYNIYSNGIYLRIYIYIYVHTYVYIYIHSFKLYILKWDMTIVICTKWCPQVGYTWFMNHS